MLVLLAVSAMVGAAPATAGEYTVWSCRALDGSPVATVAWHASGTAGARSDDCATGGALRAAVDATDTTSGDISGWQFTAPPGTVISRYRLWRAVRVAAPTSGFAAGTAGATGLGGNSFSEGCLVGSPCGLGSLVDPNDPSNDTQDVAGSFPGVTIAARCVANCTATTGPAAEAALYRSAIELTDVTAPAVGAPAGTLLDPGAPAGRHGVLVAVADLGGGVARTDLVIDGTVVQSTPTGGACVEPYAVPVPCARQSERGFVVDTRQLSPGSHIVAARAVDAAGNVTVGPAVAFAVPALTQAPPSPVPPIVVTSTPTPTPRALRLTLPRRASLPRRTWRLGTARWTDGSRAGGVRLDVYAGPVGAAADELEWRTRVKTDSKGRFTLPRSSSSRMLRVQPADAAHVATPADIDMVAPLRVRLNAPKRRVRNGSTATLRGTIRGAGDAAKGMTVLVQAVVGGRWSTVDAVTASRSGAVRWKYRFRHTRRTAEYRFRLVVRSARRLPWKTTASPRRVVRVTGTTSRR